MDRPSSLPLPPNNDDVDDETFRDRLLEFTSSHKLWQMLCGGVHMLDFLVREPDLYESVLPVEWREWLEKVNILDVIDLLNREDSDTRPTGSHDEVKPEGWRAYSSPPITLVSYIETIRSLLLDRTFYDAASRPRQSQIKPLSKRLAIGMNKKKLHEVQHFSAFISDMCDEIQASTNHSITDIVDFGAGQGYLGRSLASPLYKIDVVSIESKTHNVTGAQRADMLARVVEREVIYRNKKMFREGVDEEKLVKHEDALRAVRIGTRVDATVKEIEMTTSDNGGMIRHVEHRIVSGDLGAVVEKLSRTRALTTNKMGGDFRDDHGDQLMVVSLHSCGNLLHHGLRSLVMNDAVKAVAMVGCCYNLCTERIGGPTFKLPNLRYRTQNRRLLETSNACDADGFPMSEHFLRHKHGANTGVRLNITARMMAVQAPRNWTREECDDFFTRHWYRALLQRILLEHGIVELVDLRGPAKDNHPDEASAKVQPITIGRLPKACFKSFTAYVRGALTKLVHEEARGGLFRKLGDKLEDADIAAYETRYIGRRHELCVLWSLMAFSAGVVETLIILDRWQWLREQKGVGRAWVQSVFEYSQSPRNLVVVGIKS